MTFSEKLDHLCLAKGKTVRAVALEVGFDPSAAAQWKKRGGKPRPEITKKLADYFGVSIDKLLDDTITLPSAPPAVAVQGSKPRADQSVELRLAVIESKLNRILSILESTAGEKF